ncbi:hypothetical protein [Streptomyces sp. NBC_01451]|uniref:hypothetical protein n=1 Tax=Streptomyces sp. NBC_01451 TaxID=2903872 RepID=UPI002E30F5C6|nr:hypothetical protein [Streptomyces sp. NBC_01451]
MALKESLYGTKGLDPATGFISGTESFVGLRNYADIFGSAGEQFWNTTFFTVATVGLEAVIGVAMARSCRGLQPHREPLTRIGNELRSPASA